MENFRENKLWYFILLLFIINWLTYFFHSLIGIGVVQSFIIDVLTLVLILILIFVKKFKISIFIYINLFLIVLLIIMKNYFLYQYLENFSI